MSGSRYLRMLELLPAHVARYLTRRAAHANPVLRRMEAQAAREGFPIVGPQVGRVLAILARAIHATRIFEMGSGFGYSGLWLATALPKGARVTLTEASPARAKQARAYFEKARQAGKADCLIGDAVELMRRAKGPFDLIFLDVDKEAYPRALKTALPKLRPGGFFIADNVLWSGRVAEPRPDEATQGILEFTRLLYATPTLSTCILPLRDGLSISLKG